MHLGIDHESLKAINPSIVYDSISSFGQDGPSQAAGLRSDYPGMGRLMSITSAPGEGPMRVGILSTNLTAIAFCAIGILTALMERDMSGQGQ